GEIRIRFDLPPGTTFWPDAGLPVTVIYEQQFAADAPPINLTVLLNGNFVTTLLRKSRLRSATAKEARFRLPQAFLRTHNELVLASELEPATGCPVPHPEEQLAVSGASFFDLRGAKDFATLPDLAAFGGSGFPFTRRADLGETAILMPALPSPRTLSSLLSVSAHLAHVAGANASRAEFISDAKAPLDRDL